MKAATLTTISPWTQGQHPVEVDRVQAIIKHVRSVGSWDLPPILVIEDEGNGATILDGHHRCYAARELDKREIPAWVISVADYCAIIEEHYDGYAPERLADIREHIQCGDVDGNGIA